MLSVQLMQQTIFYHYIAQHTLISKQHRAALDIFRWATQAVVLNSHCGECSVPSSYLHCSTALLALIGLHWFLLVMRWGCVAAHVRQRQIQTHGRACQVIGITCRVQLCLSHAVISHQIEIVRQLKLFGLQQCIDFLPGEQCFCYAKPHTDM